MLNSFPPLADPLPRPVWLDLLSPTDAERDEAERRFGLSLPTRDALSEIETSSRIRERDGVLLMSLPSVAGPPNAAGQPDLEPAPIGFVLSADALVTVRFMALPSFDATLAQLAETERPPASALEVFVLLCEEIVDHIADGLERTARELAAVSATAFKIDRAQRRRPERSNGRLLVQLRGIGRHGDRLSDISDSLLGLARILAFASRQTETWEGGALAPRMASLIADVTSLSDYETRLSDKVQFLLDATVGLISIAQNDIFKVLTIVSIVGIPPTLIASLYGMNFKNMPELSWTYGYPYGLAMIVLSAVIPLLWFKMRGWF